MLLKHSIVTVARSSRKRKEKWFIFVLEMIVAEHSETNLFIKSQSTSHFHTYLRLYKDFVIIAQRDCRRNLTTMKWSDATTAQNPMTQFDEIISVAAFLFSFSRNIYEILMVFNDTVWILEKMFIMKLHKILLHLQRKLWHMFCSTTKKKEEMCWLITSNGLSPRPIERRLDWVFYKTELKIWAVGCGLGWTVLKKVWADYEQLLREVISTFCGQKKKFFFENIVASALKSCIEKR